MTLPYCRSWLMGGGGVGSTAHLTSRHISASTMTTGTSSFVWSTKATSSSMITRTTRRWMGSKPGSPGSMPGEVVIRNEQNVLTGIDENLLRAAMARIRRELGYETYDVCLVLTDDETVQGLNREFRGVDAPTDILSFHLQTPISPGVLDEPEFDVPDYYDLGEIFIDVPYVIRRMEEDRIENEKNGHATAIDDESNPDYEWVEEGVSGAMSTVYDPELRLHLLLIHGMLHLVGYDHEEDEDYDLMVAREEEMMEKLGFLDEVASDDAHEDEKLQKK